MKNVIKKIIEKSRILKYFKDKNQLMILNYHRLNDPNKINLFDDGVFGPDADRFEQEMKWLKAETNIISESEMVDMLKNKIKPDGVCSMVTFDDGYIDNYEIAYPIIKKHSIPAIFFIPTKIINDRMLGWWDIASYLVKKSSKNKIIFREINWDLKNKKIFIAKILFELKKIEPSRVDKYLNELSITMEVELPNLELQSKELMTWDQIKEVSKNGITIGSHTHEHIILSKQPLIDIGHQIKISKDILEKQLGKPIHSLSYPVGHYDHFDIETKQITQELGFKLGFSFLTGVNRYEKIDPFDVKRGSSQGYWSNLDLALTFPERVFNGERIYRGY